MSGFPDFMLLSGNASRSLAFTIAEHLNTRVGEARVGRFSDGEIRVEIHDNIRGRDVFIIQSTCHPSNDNLMELLIMIDACKRASAGRLTAVIPYYGYARQDRKVASRAPITAKLVADLLTASGVTRVLTMELHAGQIQGFFNMPVDNLYSSPLLTPQIREEVQKRMPNNEYDPRSCVIVSPDAGGVERARTYADRLGCSLAIVDKRRSGPNEAEVMHMIGDVDNKIAILIDDLVDTAGTLTKAAKATLEHGATDVIAACTHSVLSGPAVSRIKESVLSCLLVTDTIPLQEEAQSLSKIRVVSVAPLLAEAISAVHTDSSISRLFY